MVTNTFYKLVFPRDALINCPELVEEKVRKGFSLGAKALFLHQCHRPIYFPPTRG